MKFDHNNISPLDSRYANKISNFRQNFSESELIKIRFEIEIEWILFLCNKLPKTFKPLSKKSIEKIVNFKNSFNNKSVIQIKKIESTTNHDVKAVEYFIRDYFKKDKVLSSYIHLIHFGLTSEDINSLSYAVMIKKGISLYINEISSLKFSGATGNYHTFDIVDTKIKWSQVNKKFIKQFAVDQNPYTTQIEPHDWIAESCHSIIRINNILTDLCQDAWIYISNDIFALKLLKNEVGSSTMPHKVNPIDFENAEGNFGISSALLEFFANKLTRSRHQRDLSDSTVLRNVGLGFAYSALAIKSANNGLNKITPNKAKIKNELNDNWEVLTEAVQTLMRYEGIPDAYEQLKKLSRGSKLDQDAYVAFVNSLSISKKSKDKLLNLRPELYIGKAQDIAKSSY